MPDTLAQTTTAASKKPACRRGGPYVFVVPLLFHLAPERVTHDNGGEFARHQAVTDSIGLRAYFCDPRSPWQRGSIENANGRLRRDLPRKTSLAGHTDDDIDDVIWNLNATPRKCLQYRTPIEAFAANLGVALEM
jgi:transposase, IS30 family